MERSLRTLALLLVVVLAVRTLHWYPLLPDPFPIHFNGAGVPDGWAAKTPLAWAMIPGIGLLLVVVLGTLGRYTGTLAVRTPNLFNLPEKARFLALDAEGRRRAMAPLAVYLQWVSLLVAALFLHLVEGLGRVATGMSSIHPVWPVFLFLAGVLGGLPWLVHATNKAVRQGR